MCAVTSRSVVPTHPLRTFIVGYIPHNVLSYTVSIPSYSTGIYELKEIKYIYGELFESKI